MRIGFGYDVHQYTPDRPLWLGGIEVPSPKGLLGHSDADVLIHALCDALLGAAGMRDIGFHFPDTPGNEYQGIDSKILLARVVEMLHDKGYRLGNCDITVCAQTPKLNPTTDCVSIKATTTERLGFVGREEGMSAYAVVLIETIDE